MLNTIDSVSEISETNNKILISLVKRATLREFSGKIFNHAVTKNFFEYSLHLEDLKIPKPSFQYHIKMMNECLTEKEFLRLKASGQFDIVQTLFLRVIRDNESRKTYISEMSRKIEGMILLANAA